MTSKPSNPAKGVTQPRPVGRPSEYTQEAADEICRRLAEGESLRAICKDDHLPPESTVRMWVVDDREGFAAQYTRARDVGLDCRAEKIAETIETEGDTQRARLIFDHERWYLSKLAPKRFGDKLAHVGGGPDDAPIQTQSAVTIYIPDNGRDAG